MSEVHAPTQCPRVIRGIRVRVRVGL